MTMGQSPVLGKPCPEMKWPLPHGIFLSSGGLGAVAWPGEACGLRESCDGGGWGHVGGQRGCLAQLGQEGAGGGAAEGTLPAEVTIKSRAGSQ